MCETPREPLREYTADLHVHIGRTSSGRPVKISASADLTFRRIAEEASERKGIDLIGVIDCHSPDVLDDVADCLDRGEMEELPGGGVRFRRTVLLLGSEIEVKDPGFGAVHVLAFFPTVADMRSFSDWLARRMRNVRLSSQRVRASARELQREVLDRGGLFVPAHIFTPHKGLYGSGAPRMAQLLDPEGVSAVELGLSADTRMAGYLSELDDVPFLTNSDAHSPASIGREYNVFRLAEPTFIEVARALRGECGRGVVANYGLHPRLGKYYRSFCPGCGRILDADDVFTERCPHCGNDRLVRGVLDRIRSIADREVPHVPAHRPPYIAQVPLRFVPGVGAKTLERLLARFGTEMDVLHRADPRELAEVAGEAVAARIIAAREGKLEPEAGGGGRYGKIRA